MQTISSSAPRILLVSVLAVAFVLFGCDSGGSSDNDNGNGDGNGNGDNGPAATFTVTVAEKTDAHPFSGQGFNEGYVVDGEQGREVVLERGATYEFQMDGVPSIHPFYITTSVAGVGDGEYSEGVENNGASEDEVLTFTPPSSAPDTLYYNCVNHAYMGGLITFSGSSGGSGGPY